MRRLSVSGGLRVIAAALLVLVIVAVVQQSLRQRRDLLAASEREMARLVMVYATQADRSFATASSAASGLTRISASACANRDAMASDIG